MHDPFQPVKKALPVPGTSGSICEIAIYNSNHKGRSHDIIAKAKRVNPVET